MRHYYTALAALALLFSLCACSTGGGEENDGLRLYFPARSGSGGLLSLAVGSEDYYGGADVDSMMEGLLSGPSGEGLDTLIDEEVRLLGWALYEGILQVDMSAAYGELAGVDLTLADCCITLTLSQLEGVERVYITAGGSEVAHRADQVLTAEDMIFTGAEEEPRQISVELYFPRSVDRGLGFEVRELMLTEDDDLYIEVTKALLAGPQSSALHTPFPEGMEVLGVRVADGICYVNFPATLKEKAPGDPMEQDLLLYSIVDTLGNLDAVRAVQLLIEGEIPKNYGSVNTSLPLEPDFSLVEGQ